MLPRKCRGVMAGSGWLSVGSSGHRLLPLGTALGCCLHVPLSPGTLWEALKMIMWIFSLSLAISTNTQFINMQMRR